MSYEGFKVKCVAAVDGLSEEDIKRTWDLTVGAVYDAKPNKHSRHDFDYCDDAGDWVWGRWEDDPVCVWEKVEG